MSETCRKCGAPAVRVQNTGDLSCTRQCDEHPVKMARRLALEESNADLARRISKELPVGTGFCLVMYDYGERGSMAFASSGDRPDTISMLRELADKLERDR